MHSLERKWFHSPWIFLVWCLSWIYKFTFLNIFNVFANAYYLFLIVKAKKIKEIINLKRSISKRQNSITDVNNEIQLFRYHYDGIRNTDEEYGGNMKNLFSVWPTCSFNFCFSFQKKKR